MGRTYKAELATLHAKLAQRGQVPSATKDECTKMRSRVISLESELADLTQKFIVLGQMRDEERAMLEASHAEVRYRADDLAMRLLQARSCIHSTLSLEYGLADEPSEPQLAFHHLQDKVAEKEVALRVATTEISTLQVQLDIERQGYTSSPNMERELVRLRHSYG